MGTMSSSRLYDIFSGRSGEGHCVRAIMSLESPRNAMNYLKNIHKIFEQEYSYISEDGDQIKNKKKEGYLGHEEWPNITPIMKKDLADSEFMEKQSKILSFDISRFIEFLAGYTMVHDDIKPIMLHYCAIYLLDFYSRTWLKYERNRGHGIQLISCETKHSVKFWKFGIFPRAVDAFYLSNQSSLFSLDNDSGIGYSLDLSGRTVYPKIKKIKYSEGNKISLDELIRIYEELIDLEKRKAGNVGSNPILVAYVILFIMSSISRYRSEDWLKILADRNQKNEFDLLQHDLVYDHIPDLLSRTIVKADSLDNPQ